MKKNTAGIFEFAASAGGQNAGGEITYDPTTQIYTMVGSGFWDKQDECFFVALKASGDFIFTAQVWEKILGNTFGMMLRQNLNSDATYVSAVVQNAKTFLQYRGRASDNISEVESAFAAADILQLERAGASVIMRVAKNGEPLKEVGRVRVDFAEEIFVGLFACQAQTVSFANLRFDVPAATGVNGYEFPSPSRLEVLEVATGLRKVVYVSNNHFEAPNWSRDGKYLLFNQDGKIYKFFLEGLAEPELLNTGNVVANNNDHGISFDGKYLALSSHTEEAGQTAGSQIYVVPITGGKPKKITSFAPSYWHGWSPDGKTLVYCAERNNNYDVYSIPLDGGPETRLTTDPGLDDGPEFSPDAEFIYLNSTRTGQMKIWRMKPDGSHQEQISFGDGNDWFAHPSPNGKCLVYVTYPLDVPAASHPHNQRVMIREQNLETGEIRVLAHLYGGQGTLNVPSWSPDGKYLAFVSYTYGNP